jgi:hypothetical protein
MSLVLCTPHGTNSFYRRSYGFSFSHGKAHADLRNYAENARLTRFGILHLESVLGRVELQCFALWVSLIL